MIELQNTDESTRSSHRKKAKERQAQNKRARLLILSRGGLGGEPEAEGEERLVALVAVVHGQLVHGLEPRPRQLPREPVVAEQHVRDALPLRAGQPRGDERVHVVHVRVHHQRAPRHDEHHALDHPAHVLDHLRPRRRDRQVLVVARRLRVGGLAHRHHRVLVLVRALGQVVLVRPLRVLHRRVLVHRLLDGLQDRGAHAGEVVAALPLPRRGPAAALAAQVVRVAAGHEDLLLGLLRQRQQRLLPLGLAVLEQHQRLAHGLPRQRPVVLRAQLLGEPRVRERVLEEAHGELDPQDPAHGVVHALQLDLPLLHLLHQVGDELRVVVRDHHHVDAGVDRLLDRVVVVHVPRVVSRSTACQSRVGDEELVLVHLDPVPAGVGDHDGGDALDDGVVVGRHVDPHQVVEVEQRVVLVDALVRAAVAHEVLGAPGHLLGPAHERHALGVLRGDVALQARHYAGGHELHQPRVLAVALVAPAPPRVTAHLKLKKKSCIGIGIVIFGAQHIALSWITRGSMEYSTYRDAWCEGVGDAGGPGLVRRGLPDPLHQRGIPGGAEADVVGEDGGVVDVVVAVHGVDAVDDGDAEAGLERRLLHLGHHLLPDRRGRLLRRHAASAAQHAACNDRVTISIVGDSVGGNGSPTKYFSMTSSVALALSICDIWPIFSSSVIRLRRSSTRSLIGCFGSLYLT
ncbi:hypothetical protein U9M48_010562 [Paspalum notatum var. saurae]|uniref:Uncharacterized protein n=1 Tax=Paspalum notatum var. saurae TaxID=547442 RepID=A0AAQ3STV6_PASNO